MRSPGGFRRVVSFVVVALVGAQTAGCSSSDDDSSAPSAPVTTTITETVELPVEVTFSGTGTPPTAIRLGTRPAVPIDGGRAAIVKSNEATGLIIAETPEGEALLAAVVPTDLAVLGPTAEVVVSVETTAASLAFRGPGMPSGEPATDFLALACIYADPGLDAAATEVQRMLDAGGDPVNAPDLALLTAVNAIVADINEGVCGPIRASDAPSKLHGRVRSPVVTASGSCLNGGIVDPDGVGRNVVCGSLDGGASKARGRASAGQTFEVDFKNPTPRWVALENPSDEGIARIVGFVAPKEWAIPGLQGLLVQLAKDVAIAFANEVCQFLSQGLLCSDGITFSEAWEKVVDKVGSSLADAETTIEFPAAAWGRPLAAVSFGGGTNGSGARGAVPVDDPAIATTFVLTVLTGVLLPAAGLVGDFKIPEKSKSKGKSNDKSFEEPLSAAFAATLSDIAHDPDSAARATERGKNPVLDALTDMAAAVGPELSKYLQAQSANQAEDLSGIQAIIASAELVKPFFDAVVRLMSIVDWKIAAAAFQFESMLDPAAMVEKVVDGTLKKLIPGVGWLGLTDTIIDSVNLFGSSAELLWEMSTRSSADLFWLGERLIELPPRRAVTAAEMASLDGTALCREYLGDEISAQEAMYPEFRYTGSPGVWVDGEFLVAVDGPAFALGDFDGDSIGDGAVAIACESNAGTGSSYSPSIVVVLAGADRSHLRVDDPLNTSPEAEVSVARLSVPEAGLLRIDSYLPRPFNFPGTPPNSWRSVRLSNGSVDVIEAGTSGEPVSPRDAAEDFTGDGAPPECLDAALNDTAMPEYCSEYGY